MGAIAVSLRKLLAVIQALICWQVQNIRSYLNACKMVALYLIKI